MTDHTCTEKIGGDSICFCSHPSWAENRYDSIDRKDDAKGEIFCLKGYLDDTANC